MSTIPFVDDVVLSPGPIHLVMSGAYVGQELAIELGALPPSMIPVGNARLYELQVQTLSVRENIFFCLPATYRVPVEDGLRLGEFGAQVVPLPDGLTLGEAVAYSLNYIGGGDRSVHILLGDTLIRDLPTGSDVLAVAGSTDDYVWADVDTVDGIVADVGAERAGGAGERRRVAAGYFACSSSSLLVRSILVSHGDFNKGISAYSRSRALTVCDVKEWYDFGHIQTFFQSRRMISTARAFNQVEIGQLVVRKSSSSNADKIRAEAHWLNEAPAALRPYCSRVISTGEVGATPFYETEYEYMLTLSELYMFGRIGKPGWLRVIGACNAFLNTCADIPGNANGNELLRVLTSNMFSRLERFARESGFDIAAATSINGQACPSLLKVAEDLQRCVDFDTPHGAHVMHGDFCFSNIFYNSRACRVRVIDPRGYVREGEFSHVGDTRYDLAKLAHSAVGRYDLILGGRYRSERHGERDFTLAFEDDPMRLWVQDAFGDVHVGGHQLADHQIHAVMTGLFLSMLPLHSDRPDRQQAFIANSLRLYVERF